MEALYNGAKLLQHGAQSPDTPGAPARPFNISAQTAQIDNAARSCDGVGFAFTASKHWV